MSARGCGRGSSAPLNVTCTSRRGRSRQTIPIGTCSSRRASWSAWPMAMRPSTRRLPNMRIWPTTPGWWSLATGARACHGRATSQPGCRKRPARRWPAGRQVHVLHLGDVYYSGLETEDQRRFLDLWPVTQEQADAGVTSWSLNGNHDMYSGGFGYFGTLLGDPRFKASAVARRQADQLSSGCAPRRGTSSASTRPGTLTSRRPARLRSSRIRRARMSPMSPPGHRARLVLFSHHQLVSVYDRSDLGSTLPAKLAPVLNGNRVTAWWWGHEHRAIAYGASGAASPPAVSG